MIIDKTLKKFLKETGKTFSATYLPATEEWRVTIDDKTSTKPKLQDALRNVWLEISNIDNAA